MDLSLNATMSVLQLPPPAPLSSNLLRYIRTENQQLTSTTSKITDSNNYENKDDDDNDDDDDDDGASSILAGAGRGGVKGDTSLSSSPTFAPGIQLCSPHLLPTVPCLQLKVLLQHCCSLNTQSSNDYDTDKTSFSFSFDNGRGDGSDDADDSKFSTAPSSLLGYVPESLLLLLLLSSPSQSTNATSSPFNRYTVGHTSIADRCLLTANYYGNTRGTCCKASQLCLLEVFFSYDALPWYRDTILESGKMGSALLFL
jgi:hypothetical protein